MPLRLHGHIPGQPGPAVVGALPGRQRRAAGQSLAQRQCDVVRLARADEEPHRRGPALTGERCPEQVLGRLVPLGPVPALIDHGRIGRPPDGFDDLGMTVPDRRSGVARVDDLTPIGEPEPHAVGAHHRGGRRLPGRQAGRQQPRRAAHDSGAPPMPQRSAGTPSSTTQVCARTSSPYTWQKASVSAAMSRSRTAGSANLRSTAFTSIRGMAVPSVGEHFRRPSLRPRLCRGR